MRPTFVRAVDALPLSHGLYVDELETLARFNQQRSQGLAHDPEWAEAMAELQARFDAAVPR